MIAYLLFLGPAALCLLADLLSHLRRSEKRHAWRRGSIAYLLTYLCCFALIASDPQWYDNGSPETIDFPGQFIWALWIAIPLQCLLVPAFYCILLWSGRLLRQSK